MNQSIFIHPDVQPHHIPQHLRQPCEVWTRVMGYHRPVSAFNLGKQSEHRERLHFQETAIRRQDR